MQLTDTLSHNIIYHKRDTDEPITKAVSKYTGCANKKTIPYEKFIISVTVKDFFTKFTAFTKEDSRHMRSKFRHKIYYGLKITTI